MVVHGGGGDTVVNCSVGCDGDVVIMDGAVDVVGASTKAIVTFPEARDSSDRAGENNAKILPTKIIENIIALWEEVEALRSELKQICSITWRNFVCCM